MTNKIIDDIILYNVDDIKSLFQCGNNKAYLIMNANGFPSVKLGGKLLVEKEALKKWIQKNQGKEVIIR